jgi:hypothetical protein
MYALYIRPRQNTQRIVTRVTGPGFDFMSSARLGAPLEDHSTVATWETEEAAMRYAECELKMRAEDVTVVWLHTP